MECPVECLPVADIPAWACKKISQAVFVSLRGVPRATWQSNQWQKAFINNEPPSLLWPGALFIFKSSFLGDDLNPVAVRIIDKVDDHILILITDAAHFFMQGMGACEIIDFESQMEFIIT